MFVNLKQILHDQVNVYVETGARSAYLFSVEWYNNNIILTPLNPCIGVNSDTVEDNGNQILLKQSIYHDTVKVRTFFDKDLGFLTNFDHFWSAKYYAVGFYTNVACVKNEQDLPNLVYHNF